MQVSILYSHIGWTPLSSGKSGPKDQVALHYYYTSPSHWCTTHEVSTISLAVSAGTLMASAGTPYRLVPAHFYPCPWGQNQCQSNEETQGTDFWPVVCKILSAQCTHHSWKMWHWSLCANSLLHNVMFGYIKLAWYQLRLDCNNSWPETKNHSNDVQQTHIANPSRYLMIPFILFIHQFLHVLLPQVFLCQRRWWLTSLFRHG